MTEEAKDHAQVFFWGEGAKRKVYYLHPDHHPLVADCPVGGTPGAWRLMDIKAKFFRERTGN